MKLTEKMSRKHGPNVLLPKSVKMELSTQKNYNNERKWMQLIQDIFEVLDDKSLTNCKIASKSWCHFIKTCKFFWGGFQNYRKY